jgi:hypothetical protein
VENSRRRNAKKRWPDQKRAGIGQVDSTETRLFFREGETDCLGVRVGYPKGNRSAVSSQLSAKTRTYQIGSITIDLLE